MDSDLSKRSDPFGLGFGLGSPTLPITALILTEPFNLIKISLALKISSLLDTDPKYLFRIQNEGKIYRFEQDGSLTLVLYITKRITKKSFPPPPPLNCKLQGSYSQFKLLSIPKLTSLLVDDVDDPGVDGSLSRLVLVHHVVLLVMISDLLEI